MPPLDLPVILCLDYSYMLLEAVESLILLLEGIALANVSRFVCKNYPILVSLQP